MKDILTAVTVTLLMFGYLGEPLFLLTRGWPIRAGLGMLLVAAFPFLWWHGIQGLESSVSDGFAIVILFPLPLLLTAIGIIAAGVRLVRRSRGASTAG